MTETKILTDEQIREIALTAGCDSERDDGALVAQLIRLAEQAVLQSPEVVALHDSLRTAREYVEQAQRDAETIDHVRNLTQIAPGWDAAHDHNEAVKYLRARFGVEPTVRAVDADRQGKGGA